MQPLHQPFLAFDTSGPTARVALIAHTGECLCAREKTAARHSANLLGLCDEVLRAASLHVADLGAIACGAGPGSFTGLRVGLAVAKGLALPTDIPLVLVPSLEALALDLAGHPANAHLVLPCIDAGKGQVYARFYRVDEQGNVWAENEADWVLSPADLGVLAKEIAGPRPFLAGGTGLDRYSEIFEVSWGAARLARALPGPSAQAIARAALPRLARGDHDDLETSVPRYGRAPDITRPKKPPPSSPAV